MSDTKEKILFTALRLFAQDGYEAVSISAIAGDLGITKGALYKHYKNKRTFLTAFLSASMRKMLIEQKSTAYQRKNLKRCRLPSKTQRLQISRVISRRPFTFGLSKNSLVIFVKC